IGHRGGVSPSSPGPPAPGRPPDAADGSCEYGKNDDRRTAGNRRSAIVALENQRCVGATEAERVRERDVDSPLARLVRDEVDLGLDGRVVEVDRRRRDVVADGEHAENGLGRTGRTEQM